MYRKGLPDRGNPRDANIRLLWIEKLPLRRYQGKVWYLTRRLRPGREGT